MEKETVVKRHKNFELMHLHSVKYLNLVNFLLSFAYGHSIKYADVMENSTVYLAQICTCEIFVYTFITFVQFIVQFRIRNSSPKDFTFA